MTECFTNAFKGLWNFLFVKIEPFSTWNAAISSFELKIDPLKKQLKKERKKKIEKENEFQSLCESNKKLEAQFVFQDLSTLNLEIATIENDITNINQQIRVLKYHRNKYATDLAISECTSGLLEPETVDQKSQGQETLRKMKRDYEIHQLNPPTLLVPTIDIGEFERLFNEVSSSSRKTFKPVELIESDNNLCKIKNQYEKLESDVKKLVEPSVVTKTKDEKILEVKFKKQPINI